jgi:hypothetical protein
MNFPGQVAYSELVNSFRSSFEKPCGFIDIYPRSEHQWFKFDKFDNDTATWQFELFMHLPRWKTRKGDIYIILHAREQVERTRKDMPILKKSTVQLAYYEMEAECELLHSVHYDFAGAEDRHPLFHAQLTNEPPEVPEAICQELEIILPSPRSSLFKFARIPTSDMTLPSALLCLAADHCEDIETFEGFREKVMSVRHNMHYADASIVTKLVSEASRPTLCSSAWFGKSG